MKLRPHQVKAPTWTESDYGEPVKTLGAATEVLMSIGWTSSSQMDMNNALYQQYEYVGLTKASITVGSVVDDKYEVGHVDSTGRWIRVFMNYAEGVSRPSGS